VRWSSADDAVGVPLVERDDGGGMAWPVAGVVATVAGEGGRHVGGHRDSDEAGQDDEEGEEHLGDGSDEGNARAENLRVGAMARWMTRKSVHQ